MNRFKELLGYNNPIIKYFLKLLLIISRAIYPVKQDKSLVLFGTISGKFMDNSKYLFLYMMKNDKQFKPVWITDDIETYKSLKKLKFPVKYKWSIKSFKLVMRSSFFIYTHQLDDIFPISGKNTIKFNLWHGNPIKKIGYNSQVDKKKDNFIQEFKSRFFEQKNDYVITSHVIFKNIFKTSMNLNESKILVTGLPRNDIIFESKKVEDSHKNNIILKKLNCLCNKKVILYAPTFRDNIDGKKKLEKNLNKIIETFLNFYMNKDYVLLIRLHPYDTIKFTTMKNLIYDVSHLEDMQELLIATSVLITDYSSSIFDYSILNKPIILYTFDYDEYSKIRGGFYFNITKDLPFIVVNTNKELFKELNASLDKVYNYSNFFNIHSNSCKNIIKILETINDT